jgi:hypothetical protein
LIVGDGAGETLPRILSITWKKRSFSSADNILRRNVKKISGIT